MTIQVHNFAKSKATLQAALTETPDKVRFSDPSPFGVRCFTGAEIKLSESFAVVMDPATRMRFSMVTRRKDGTFKVT